MREILFRGKRTDNGRWVEGYLIADTEFAGKPYYHTYIVNHKSPSGCFGGDIFIEVLPETVGQYTGLTDKNGTKIFEGDIVRLRRFGNIECGKIVFNTNTAGFEFWREVTVGAYGEKAMRKENLCAFTAATSYVEIRGNIHDNPELLDGVGNG